MLRICNHCRQPLSDGFTNLEDFYAHDGDCFVNEMNNRYGMGNWYQTEYVGTDGGYYEVDGEDTGIFYTEFYGDGCDLDEVKDYLKDILNNLVNTYAALELDDYNAVKLFNAVNETVIDVFDNEIPEWNPESPLTPSNHSKYFPGFTYIFKG